MRPSFKPEVQSCKYATLIRYECNVPYKLLLSQLQYEFSPNYSP